MHVILDERDKALFNSDIDMIEDNVFVVSKSGSDIVVSDCTDDPPKGLRVFGKTEQKTTSGKQLLKCPYSEGSGVKNSITRTDNEDGSISLKGTNDLLDNNVYFNIYSNENGKRLRIKAGTYTISCICPNDVYVSGNVVDSDGNRLLSSAINIHSTNNPVTFTISSDGEMFLYIYVNPAKTIDHVFHIMLNEGTTALPYEPYTGGMASPNPEYPQELVDNQIEEIGVYGANLLPYPYVNKTHYATGVTFEETNGRISINGLPENISADYYLYGKKSDDGIYIYFPKGEYEVSLTPINDSFNDTSEFIAFRTLEKGAILGANNIKSALKQTGLHVYGIFIRAGLVGKTYNNVILQPVMTLTKDSTFLDRFEGDNKKMVINAPNGLPGIKVGDASLATYTDSEGKTRCADEVNFERGVYIQRIGKHIINESDVVDINSINEYGITNVGLNILPLNLLKANAMCSHFSEQFTTISETVSEGFLVANKKVMYLRIYSENVSTIEEAKEFLRNNVVEFYYILETPIETPLSEEELAQYKTLTMNYPNTTIINNSNAHMEVDYVADIMNHIEQNYVTREEAETLLSRVSTIEEVMV